MLNLTNEELSGIVGGASDINVVAKLGATLATVIPIAQGPESTELLLKSLYLEKIVMGHVPGGAQDPNA